MAHAFISYVRENSVIVDRLARALREAGVNVWLDRNDIRPGQRWKRAIKKAIQEGTFFIACYSEQMKARSETYMYSELRFAIDRLRTMPNDRVWFIPVFLNRTEIPEHDISDHETLADLNAVALYQDWDAGIRNILQAMKLDDPVHRRALHLEHLVLYHPPERRNAIIELVEVAPISLEAVPAFIAVLRDRAFDRLGTLRRLGPNISNAIPALLELFSDPVREMRWRAGIALAGIGAPAVPGVTRALTATDEKARLIAAATLGAIGPTAVEAISALKAVLVDPDEGVRKAAAEALEKISPTCGERGSCGA